MEHSKAAIHISITQKMMEAERWMMVQMSFEEFCQFIDPSYQEDKDKNEKWLMFSMKKEQVVAANFQGQKVSFEHHLNDTQSQL